VSDDAKFDDAKFEFDWVPDLENRLRSFRIGGDPGLYVVLFRKGLWSSAILMDGNPGDPFFKGPLSACLAACEAHWLDSPADLADLEQEWRRIAGRTGWDHLSSNRRIELRHVPESQPYDGSWSVEVKAGVQSVLTYSWNAGRETMASVLHAARTMFVFAFPR
jgi:hypothetical protein